MRFLSGFCRVVELRKRKANRSAAAGGDGGALALQTEENLRAGMPTAEARRQAVLKFGAVEAVSEHHHAEHSLPIFENLRATCGTRFACW